MDRSARQDRVGGVKRISSELFGGRVGLVIHRHRPVGFVDHDPTAGALTRRAISATTAWGPEPSTSSNRARTRSNVSDGNPVRQALSVEQLRHVGEACHVPQPAG